MGADLHGASRAIFLTLENGIGGVEDEGEDEFCTELLRGAHFGCYDPGPKPAMLALIATVLLQVTPPGLAGEREATSPLADARAALGDNPSETIKIASAGISEHEGEPDAQLIELCLVLGTAHQLQEEFTAAVSAYDQAEELGRAIEARRFELQTLSRRAYCLRMLGDFEGALEDLHRVLEVHQGRGDSNAAAETLNELAIVYLKLGETGEAIACWREAIERFEQLNRMASVSITLGNLGILHGDLGQNSESIACIERSMALAEDHPGGASLAYNLVNLCDAYRGLGDTQRARSLIEQAIELLEESGSRHELASARTHLGLIHSDLGDHHRALEILMGIEEVYGHLELETQRAAVMANIATVLSALDRTDEAVDVSREVLAHSRKSESKDVEIDARLALAESLQASGDPDGAAVHRRRASQLESEVRSDEHRREMEGLYAELEMQRRERELLQRQTDLDRRSNERRTLIAGLVALLVTAATGWSVVIMRRRSYRALLESFGALQAANAQLIAREAELGAALSRIDRLEVLLPICSECKAIRDTDSEWRSLESYFASRSDLRFTHGYCPTCYEAVMERLKAEGHSE